LRRCCKSPGTRLEEQELFKFTEFLNLMVKIAKTSLCHRDTMCLCNLSMEKLYFQIPETLLGVGMNRISYIQ
jgi:hypothetical protein